MTDTKALSADEKTADVILRWLAERNGGELSEALDEMRVKDARLMREELVSILKHKGYPPNWVNRG